MKHSAFRTAAPSRRCVPLGVLLLCAGFLSHAGEGFDPKLAKADDGSWQGAGNGYTARINKEGHLASLKVGEIETLGEPFSYQPRSKLVADQAEAAGDTLKVHLKGSGEATIHYKFRPDGLTVTPTWKAGGFAEFYLTASPRLLGIELLNDKSATVGGDAVRFVDQGEIRGVPAVPSSRNQMVRFHFPGFGLHAYVQAWGAPFNYESAGSTRGRAWGRPLLAQNKAFPIVLTIQPGANKAALAAPVFVPRTDKVMSLYYADEPCMWNVDLGERKAYQYLLDAGVTSLDVAWRLTDIHDKQVGTGKDTITLDATAPKTAKAVEVKAPGTGYYQVLFTLSEPAGKMLPSSFLTRFTVIRNAPGKTNRDDTLAGKNLNDYAVVSMIGIGGIRESHDIGGFFSNQPQKEPEWAKVEGTEPALWMNVKRLDELFNTASSESKKYNLTMFFQANSRPDYAKPELYEAMAFALVSRYKDRCRAWEVENEPNFRYPPEKYVNLCLIPFHKGAKRADPNCVVMGPGCVGLKDTLRFMETIYKLDAHKYLDNISTHTYPGPGESWEQFGNPGMLNQLRAWMKAHGDENKRLWQTEQGYAWDNAARTQTARYAVRQFLQGWRLGIEPQNQYYFYPHAHGFESWYQTGGGEEGSRESWLPVAAAQRFLAENTSGLKYAGDIPTPYKGIFLSRFSGANEDVVAAWTFDFACLLPVLAPKRKSCADFMGNPVQLIEKEAGVVTLPLSGEPLYLHLDKGSPCSVSNVTFGKNLALAAEGATATASSEDKKQPATMANDGNWELWEKAGELPGRTAWMSGTKDPSPEKPDWLQIAFPAPRTINRIVALCYLPAVNASPRDFEFQAEVDGKWQTVASGKDEWTWVLCREFQPLAASKIRLVVTRINDGWQGDRHWMHVLMGPQARNYTASKLLVSELEAYGPP